MAKCSGWFALQKLEKQRYRNAAFICAIAGLALGLFLSIRDQPDVLARLDWRPALVVALLGVPVAVCLNSIEFVLTGRLIGQTVPLSRALQVTILGSAANLLPLPGGTLTRFAGLKIGGASYRDATAAVALATTMWIGVSLVYAAIAAMILGALELGMTLLVVGIIVLPVSTGLAIRRSGQLTVNLGLLAVKVLLVVTDAARLVLCLHALGTAATFLQSSTLTVSGLVGSMVSIVPAGLGVREAAAAGLSPLVGLAAASGFLAATLNRILGLAAVLPMAGFVFLWRSRPAGRASGQSRHSKLDAEACGGGVEEGPNG